MGHTTLHEQIANVVQNRLLLLTYNRADRKCGGFNSPFCNFSWVKPILFPKNNKNTELTLLYWKTKEFNNFPLEEFPWAFYWRSSPLGKGTLSTVRTKRGEGASEETALVVGSRTILACPCWVHTRRGCICRARRACSTWNNAVMSVYLEINVDLGVPEK